MLPVPLLHTLPRRPPVPFPPRHGRYADAGGAAGAGLGGTRAVDARGPVTGQGFVAQAPHHWFRHFVAGRLHRIAQVGQQLRVLLPHDGGVWEGAEAGIRQRRGDLAGHVIHAGGIAAHIQYARRAFCAMHHLARRQVFRRQEHDHAVHAPEAPRRHALVVHTVLATDHRQGVPRHPLEFTQRSFGLVALHAEQHHVPGLTAGLRRAARDRNPQTHILRRGDEAQPLALQGAQVGTTSDEQHIHAVLEEPRTHGTANATRPVDDESHPLGPHPPANAGHSYRQPAPRH